MITNSKSPTENVLLNACRSHETIESLLVHLTQEPLDKDYLNKQANIRAKKEGLLIDDLDFYGMAVLFEISDIISTQFNIKPSEILVLQSYCSNGGSLEIDGCEVGSIDEFEYWKNGSYA